MLECFRFLLSNCVLSHRLSSLDETVPFHFCMPELFGAHVPTVVYRSAAMPRNYAFPVGGVNSVYQYSAGLAPKDRFAQERWSRAKFPQTSIFGDWVSLTYTAHNCATQWGTIPSPWDLSAPRARIFHIFNNLVALFLRASEGRCLIYSSPLAIRTDSAPESHGY